ncbi:MAG: hypothetical protein U0R17_05250 [Acidimicrobiia bacterium]
MFKSALPITGACDQMPLHWGVDYDPLSVRKLSGFGNLIDDLTRSTDQAVRSIADVFFDPSKSCDDRAYECLEIYCHDSGVSISIDFSATQIDIRINYGTDCEVLISDVLGHNGNLLGLPDNEIQLLIQALMDHEKLIAYARRIDQAFSQANGRPSYLQGKNASKVRFISDPNYSDIETPPHVDYGDLTVVSAANDPDLYTFINRQAPNGAFQRDDRVAIEKGDLQLFCATRTHHCRPTVQTGETLHRIAAITGFNR